jgi:hypothetical protein
MRVRSTAQFRPLVQRLPVHLYMARGPSGISPFSDGPCEPRLTGRQRQRRIPLRPNPGEKGANLTKEGNMSTSYLRFFGLALLALLSSAVARAQYFEGDTAFNFDTLGGTSYNLSFFASTTVGGSETGWAYASFGPLYASSVCNAGEAGAGIAMSNIRKVGSQWVAEYVTLYELKSDASGYDYTYYSNVVLPTSATAYGEAQCADQTRSIYGWLDIY